jgi:hypothetical protein
LQSSASAPTALARIVRSGREPGAAGDCRFDEIGTTIQAVDRGLRRPAPTEAVAILRARVAEFAYGTLTDDLCLLAARIS